MTQSQSPAEGSSGSARAPRSAGGTPGVRALLGLLLLGLLTGVACRDSSEEPQDVHAASQPLLEEDFEDGVWPPTFDKAGACAAVRATSAAVFCDAPSFDPHAAYSAGSEVSVGHAVYACTSEADPSLCSQDTYEPGTGANWQRAWTVARSCNHSQFGAQLADTCWMQNTVQISTLGYANIQVHYDFTTVNYDLGETLELAWSTTGTSWHTAAVHAASPSWSSVTTVLPVEAANQRALFLRFSTNANGTPGPERASIDNIRVTGEAPAGCDYAQLCEGASAACGVLQDPTCDQFSCGFCPAGQGCQGHQCVVDCSPLALCHNVACGQVQVAGCDPTVCGSCSAGKSCVQGACVDSCSAAVVCPAKGAECGKVSAGACGEVDCGSCAGGSCENNKCSCEPTTCDALGAHCGHPDNGCGDELDCGLCPGVLDICESNYQCSPDPCQDCGPLTPDDIAVFENYLECSAACHYGKLALLDACLAQCPPEQQRWDKNRDGQVDDIDRELAALELNDNGSGTLICYENRVVVPIKACASCADVHGAAFCDDKDGAGLGACGTDRPCADFDHECRYVPDANQKLCVPRACAGPPSQCTAFHLEEVAQDNDEVIVHVFYDYSPVPITVFDLYLSYASDALTLADSRALAGLTSSRKSLQASQSGAGRLRLVALGGESTAPIAPGPVAELVFLRSAPSQSDLGFSTSDFDQTWSVAPDQAAAQSLLANDALWGSSITIKAVDPNGDRLMLYYSFDNPQKPLDVAKVKDGDELCNLYVSGEGQCPPANAATEEETTARGKAVARYNALQHGVVQAEQRISGVSGAGVFLDGISDHLELPITLNQPLTADAQSFTASFWFYSEGDLDRFQSGGNSDPVSQILWTHNHPLSERSLFAVTLTPGDNDTFDLAWLEGLSETPTIIKSGLPNRAWSHLAIAYDAPHNKVQFYLDGSLVQTQGAGAPLEIAPPQIACPQFAPDFKIGEEGSGTGTSTPQVIYFSSAQNGLFGLERMDATGLARQTLLREPDSSAKDVHYSPLVDKIVYASSKSGSFEIWVANGDGSQARQVTFGFGDTARGIFARRPRWAPDASAVVFESNVYSVPDRDNTEVRGSRLFYLAYDARTTNEFAIPYGEQTLTSFDYGMFVVASTALDKVRLTDDDVNSSNAFWGRSSNPEEGLTLWYTVMDEHWDEPRVKRLVLNTTSAANSRSESFEPLGAGARVRLLAAGTDSKEPDATPESVLLLEQEWIAYEPASLFTVALSTTSAGDTRAQVRYTPGSFDLNCWDRIRNRVCDIEAGEDTNGDGVCDQADCPAPSVENLYLEVPEGFAPDKDETTSAIVDKTNPRELSAQKDLRLSEVSTGWGDFVRIEVRSPIDRAPIVPETVIATLDFTGTASIGGNEFALTTRERHAQLYTFHPGKANQPVAFDHEGLDEVLGAAFSPDADSLVLYALERARPVVVTTPDLTGTVSGASSMRKISSAPVAVEGLQWVSVDRALPCNWLGAFRQPASKQYTHAFRGGLDELKMHSYVRNAGAIRSEAERGRERLAKDQPSGPGAQAAPCSVSAQCPPYQICEGNECRTQPCDPDDPYACEGNGKCTLAASVDIAGGSTGKWVCAAECSGSGEAANSTCFSQQCRNGPCRYCDETTQACIECRETVKTELGTTTTQIEGCPDRNSFACVAGSCVTDCYSFEDGASMYLCNPSTEYCKQGRCVMFDWSWTDLAPATFSGMAEMQLHGVTSTIAIPQLYPVVVKAHGVEDYTHSPQVLVQGRVHGGPGFLDRWFDIGTITVYNRTAAQAEIKPYTVVTRYPITDLRIKLINPPNGNLNGASTGLGHLGRDVALCGGPDRPCDRRPAGSRPTMGYSVGIPQYEVEFTAACRPQGGAACDYGKMVEANQYLLAGQHAVIVTDVTVKDTSVLHTLASHKICSYEGGIIPVTPDRTLPVWFGNPSHEQSNQKVSYYPPALQTPTGDASWNQLLTVLPTHGLPLLLNCNFALPNGDVAGIEFGRFTLAYPNPAEPLTMKSGRITENANGCTVDNKGLPPTQCYEWAGDARMDFMTQDITLYKTLELQEFTSFGYEADGL